MPFRGNGIHAQGKLGIVAIFYAGNRVLLIRFSDGIGFRLEHTSAIRSNHAIFAFRFRHMVRQGRARDLLAVFFPLVVSASFYGTVTSVSTGYPSTEYTGNWLSVKELI